MSGELLGASVYRMTDKTQDEHNQREIDTLLAEAQGLLKSAKDHNKAAKDYQRLVRHSLARSQTDEAAAEKRLQRVGELQTRIEYRRRVRLTGEIH